MAIGGYAYLLWCFYVHILSLKITVHDMVNMKVVKG